MFSSVLLTIVNTLNVNLCCRYHFPWYPLGTKLCLKPVYSYVPLCLCLNMSYGNHVIFAPKCGQVTDALLTRQMT